MPERHVLHRRQRVTAQHAGEAADLFAVDRVALVRHGGRTLLPRAERLLHLAQLGLLQTAHLGGELFQAAAGDGDDAQQLGVAVALEHLRADRRRLQPHLLADVFFHKRIDVGIGADRAGDLAHAGDLVRVLHALKVALHFGIPEREFQPQRRRLGVNAVGAAHARGHLVFDRLSGQHVDEPAHIGLDDIQRLRDDAGKRGIHHVRAGQAEVQVLRFLTQALGHAAGERHNVVAGGLLDFLHALNGEFRVFAHLGGGFGGHFAQLHPCVGRVQLHLEPRFKFLLLGPKRRHLRAGIAVDHSSCPPIRRRRIS